MSSTQQGIELVQTRIANPEVYSAFIGGELVGELCLQDAEFIALVEGQVIFVYNHVGGEHFHYRDRAHFIERAKQAILRRIMHTDIHE